MKCPSCSRENPIHQQYCAGCGKKIQVEFSQVASSVRADVSKGQEAAYPRLVAQVVILALLANVALFVFSLTLGSAVDIQGVSIPATLPPPVESDRSVQMELPSLPGKAEVAALALPKLPERGSERYGYRRDPMRTKLHSARGGQAQELDAIQRGLAILVKGQDPSGMWKIRGGWNFGKATWGRPSGTGLAVLALLGDGHVWTLPDDEFGKAAGKGVRYLLSVQDESGRIGLAEGGYMFNQGIATVALSEAYAMGGLEGMKPHVEKAVAYICESQLASGGWNTDNKSEAKGDMVATAWQIHALCSAKTAGIQVPDQALDAAAKFIDALTNQTTGRTGYESPPEDDTKDPLTIVSTGMSLACRGMLGQDLTSSVCTMQKKIVMSEENLPRMKDEWKAAGTRQGDPNVYYYHYFGTVAMTQDESLDWQDWYMALSKASLTMQEKDGGWPIIGRWGYVWGKVHSTALSVLALESTYR